MSSKDPIQISNFINGDFVTCGDTFPSYSPSTGQINAFIPNSGKEIVAEAVEAAKKAFLLWSQTTIAQRVQILNRIADLIEVNLEELAILESKDQGKPLWQSRSVDIPRSVQNFRHFANALTYQTDISIVEAELGIINYTTHEPAGIVGIITPWNLPLYLLTFKLAPAIAYGNTLVAKPSEMTSVTAFKLCQLLSQSGLPNGVINMVFGYGAVVGEAIVTHPSVNLISFTGSTVTGRRIAQQAAPFFKRLSLEMGGKNAAIVFEDVKLNVELDKIVRSVYFNSGQICLASSRILVHESIFDTFVHRFINISKTYKIGDPFDEETKVSALISKEHLAKVRRYVEIAKQSAQVTYIEPKLGKDNENGYYTGLTIITKVSLDSPCMVEEIFGPVVCIVKFQDEDEAIRIANSTCYGLSATVWTESIDRMHRVAHRLQAGTVWGNCWLVRNLNMPFGGMKESGVSREGTIESREFYTNKKTVCVCIKK